jgi:hypothetical protein
MDLLYWLKERDYVNEVGIYRKKHFSICSYSVTNFPLNLQDKDKNYL